MHLPMRILPEVLDLEKCTARWKRRALLCATIVPALPNGGDPGCELLTRCTTSQEELKVHPLARVETKQTDTVRSKPRAVTGPAKRLGYRGDNSERGSVRQNVTCSWRRPSLYRQGLYDSEVLTKSIEYLAAGHDLARGPTGSSANIHVFNEAYLSIESSAEFDEIGEFVVIETSHDDDVDLELLKDNAMRFSNTIQNLGVQVAAYQQPEALRPQSIEAHCHAL
jgi:hypothetical protein